ncbi:hypothetical protein [Staphylococcus lutrae]|uniref:hypothetical protein n=1 Tax=Staphylococcus lutrae TaxID=155085 RepID=UPI001158A635|nr:hypothetical protein [Staphylococcus lutrae]
MVNSMINKPHPSLIYQLADELFLNEAERRIFISNFIEEHQLSISSSVNVTGRFREKERQAFTLNDLIKLYKFYKDILFENTRSVIFGDIYYHGIILGANDNIIVFSMYESLEALIAELL